MAFHFSLDMVLRLRQIAEEREERLLGQILQRIAETQKSISDLEVLRAELIGLREAEGCRRMPAIELHLSYQRAGSIQEEIHKLTLQSIELEAKRLQQLKLYEAAHQGRELLGDMRAAQKACHLSDRNKQEQKSMDDNFSSRLPRR